MGWLRKLKNIVLHPKATAERAVRKRLIAAIVGSVLAAAAAGGWQTSPAFREAVINAIDEIATAIDELPTAPAPELSEPRGTEGN